MPETEYRCLRVPVGELETNCYLLSRQEDGTVVIDPGDDAEKILQALHGEPIAAILLTHGHFDHIGAVDELAGPDTPVYIHTADSPMLTDSTKNASWLTGNEVTVTHAVIAVEEAHVVQAGGMEIRVMHTPGHSPGGVCYSVGPYLFTGDTMFVAGYGRTDLWGGDEAALIKSLRRIMPERGKYRIMPGHGATT